ncbi:gas vesicle protein [Streptomyces sp. SID9913]|uniref:Gas vesicle protein n=2 Tax=unclassified Streptomyces TaxID=2593676 RepID=A0A6G3R590_9ACTN|nr:gas vesicle protein [Streptomyces sp. SID14436]NEC84261.1 gas vesicle protein [Streptomyces sp. SID7958]NED22383.1 gas vesicle protein [Streptomyces sp. SID9913]
MTETGERRRGTAARTTTRDSGVRNARDAAQRAAELLSGLIRHRLEGVSAVSRDEDDGWTVHVDVLEVPRIPDTTSLLATYEVGLDPDGDLLRYRRIARYRRGAQDQ